MVRIAPRPHLCGFWPFPSAKTASAAVFHNIAPLKHPPSVYNHRGAMFYVTVPCSVRIYTGFVSYRDIKNAIVSFYNCHNCARHHVRPAPDDADRNMRYTCLPPSSGLIVHRHLPPTVSHLFVLSQFEAVKNLRIHNPDGRLITIFARLRSD